MSKTTTPTKSTSVKTTHHHHHQQVFRRASRFWSNKIAMPKFTATSFLLDFAPTFVVLQPKQTAAADDSPPAFGTTKCATKTAKTSILQLAPPKLQCARKSTTNAAGTARTFQISIPAQ